MEKYSITRKSNGIPVMSYDEIENLSLEIISDFNPELLKYPQAIDIEALGEFGLNLHIYYNDLSHNGSVLGSIALTNGTCYLYDKENNDILIRDVKAGDIFLDNQLLNYKNEGRRNFTLAHEISHYITLKTIIEKALVNKAKDKECEIIRCTNAELHENSYTWHNNDDLACMEYYANNLAAALLMPKTTVAIVIKLVFDKLNLTKPVQIGKDERSDIIADRVLPEIMAKIYRVSKQSAGIRLRRLGYIIDKQSS